jgi:hypothetical protein
MQSKPTINAPWWAGVVIPTAELVRVARQLCALEAPTDPSEQPKQVVTLQ